MKKLLYPAAAAFLLTWAATDAQAQGKSVYGGGSESQRPIPSNSDRTDDVNAPRTDGNPNQELRQLNNPNIKHDMEGSIDHKDDKTDTMKTGTFDGPGNQQRNTKERQIDRRHDSKKANRPK